jgi:hypothetical protein
MKSVADLPAGDLVKFMTAIHTNGPVGDPLTVDKLSSYLVFVYKIGELLRPVEYDIMSIDMDTIHKCAVDCGALVERPTKNIQGSAYVDTILYNSHMGVFFERLAGYVAHSIKKLPQ